MPLRMVATDLDGTIVRRDGTVSPRTLAAISACRAAGVHVVFVTGRPPRWLEPVVEETGLRGVAVCGNGAVVYDAAARRVLRSHTLDAAAVLEVARRLRAHRPTMAFAMETLDGFRREDAYVPRFDIGSVTRAPSVQDLLADGAQVVELLCRDEGASGDELLALGRRLLEGLAEPTHSNAGDPEGLLEVSAAGVSKASTLARVAAELGIGRADVAAFGDMPNDLGMLRWAGRGYAMADGHPEALEAADALAPPCAQDGVAHVVEALLAGRDPLSWTPAAAGASRGAG